jgi:hypothetical protein
MASESSRQYVSRLLRYLGKRDPFVVLRRTPVILRSLITGLPQRILNVKPAPGAWLIREIVAHLAETELVLGWRYRSIAEHSGRKIQSFDQEIWSANGRYETMPVKDSLAMFAILRSMNLSFLKGLSHEKLSSYGLHDERGKETLRQIIRLEAGHDLNHLMQIQKIAGHTKKIRQKR